MNVFTVSCCQEWKVNSVVELVAESCVPTSKLGYKLARNIASQLHEYQRVSDTIEANLNLLVINNTSITGAGGCAHAITKCSVTSNAKFIEVYDCKGVYIETFKGYTAEISERSGLPGNMPENVPLFTVEMLFKSPLMISSAKHFVIKLKPISLKVQTNAGLKPSNSLFWLEDLDMKLLKVDANSGPGSLGAAAASASALSDTMRAEDIFDLSAAMNSMGLLSGGGAASGADGAVAVAGAGSAAASVGMHSALLKSLLPSIMPGVGAAPHVQAPVSAAPQAPTSIAPPAAPTATSTATATATATANKISVDRTELVQLIEMIVDARTLALKERVLALEGQVGGLLQAQSQADSRSRSRTLAMNTGIEPSGNSELPTHSSQQQEPPELLNYEFVENEF